MTNRRDKKIENNNELRMTGGQYVDADIDIPEEEEKPISKTDDGTNLPVRSGSEKSGNVKKNFVLQCKPKDNISLSSSRKGNKLFERDNIEPNEPLIGLPVVYGDD